MCPGVCVCFLLTQPSLAIQSRAQFPLALSLLVSLLSFSCIKHPVTWVQNDELNSWCINAVWKICFYLLLSNNQECTSHPGQLQTVQFSLSQTYRWPFWEMWHENNGPTSQWETSPRMAIATVLRPKVARNKILTMSEISFFSVAAIVTYIS